MECRSAAAAHIGQVIAWIKGAKGKSKDGGKGKNPSKGKDGGKGKPKKGESKPSGKPGKTSEKAIPFSGECGFCKRAAASAEAASTERRRQALGF